MDKNLNDYLDELLVQTKPVLMADLVKLSNIGISDLKLFTQKWANTKVERRRQIISKLEEVAENSPELNFDEIFQACLNDPDQVVRVKAVASLYECEDYHIVDTMIRLLNEDSDPAVRIAAIKVLGNFSLLAELNKLPTNYSHKVAQALLAVIESNDAIIEMKRRAMEAIAPFSLPKIKEIISKAYYSDDFGMRCSALFAMGRNCSPQWLSIVLDELDSSNPELCFEAVRACGEMGNEIAVPSLIKILSDSDVEVRLVAIAALGEIGGKEAKNALLRQMEMADTTTKEAIEDALAMLEFYNEPLWLTK